MERVVIRPRRWKMVLYALVGAVMAGLPLALLVTDADTRTNPILWLAVGLGGFVAITLTAQIARGTPLLVLDQQTITVGQAGITLRWDEVRELAFVSRSTGGAFRQRQAFLAVRPHDEEAVRARLPRAKGVLVWLNARSWLDEPLVVPLNALPMSRQELRDVLARYFDGPIRAPRKRG